MCNFAPVRLLKVVSRAMIFDYCIIGGGFVGFASAGEFTDYDVLKIGHLESGEVIASPLTWTSDSASVPQNGCIPVFVDINHQLLAMDIRHVLGQLIEQTWAIFFTCA